MFGGVSTLERFTRWLPIRVPFADWSVSLKPRWEGSTTRWRRLTSGLGRTT